MIELKWLWRNLKGFRAIYIFALILSAVTSIMVIIGPQITKQIIDEVVVNKMVSRLLPLLALFCIVILVRTSLRYLMVALFEITSQAVLLKIRAHCYNVLQKQEMTFFDKYRTGDLMTRLVGDLDLVRHTTSYIAYAVVDCIIMMVATAVYLSFINLPFTIILLSVTPVVFILSFVFLKKIRPVYVELRDKFSDLNTAAQENISGNRVVKAFANEEFEKKRFGEKNEDFRRINLKATLTWLKFFPFIDFLTQLMWVGTILGGGLLVIADKISMGELTAFSSLVFVLLNPMKTLGALLNDLQRFFASSKKVIEIYYSRPLISNRHNCIKIVDRIKGEIEFKDVTFAYDNETVLEDITFSIKSGETVAFMGNTGSGKTTIVNLISRFYDVKKGEISVDGINVKDYDLGSLRKNIAIATQSVFLFSDTIAGNISYGDESLTQSEITEFAKCAAADNFISKTLDGYDTIIGERGVGLSGGQKQRLALARAIAVKPPVLILDDTTSAVDLETERYIQKKLEELDFNCTKIIVASRVSSVIKADKIIILEDKKIAEMGTHTELMEKRGLYYDIYCLQSEAAVEV